MKIKNLLSILSVSMILASCGGGETSSISSSKQEGSPYSQVIPASISSEKSSSSSSQSSSSSSTANGVHNYQHDLEDITALLKSVVGREKSFTINSTNEHGPLESVRTIVGDVENIEKNDNIVTEKVTLIHNGSDGTGYYKYEGVGETPITSEGFVQKENASYKQYDVSNKTSSTVDSDYLYYATFSDINLVQLANLPKITLSYFEKYYSSIDIVRAAAGDDVASSISLKNFSSTDFSEKDGIKKIILIYGTKSLFKGSTYPVGPDKSESLIGATYDNQMTLTIEWTDKEIVSFSSVHGSSYTKTIDDNKGKVTTTQISYRDTQFSTIKTSMDAYPTYSTNGYADNGVVSSEATFYVPLKEGNYTFVTIDGAMNDPISTETIVGNNLADYGLGVNVYEDRDKTKKVELSTLSFKSYDTTYYIDFTVPKDKSFIVVQHCLRSKEDLKRGDLTFKIYKYTTELSKVTSTWTPSNVTRDDGHEFQSIGIEVITSSDRFAKANGKTISVKGGNYYVIKNNADEI